MKVIKHNLFVCLLLMLAGLGLTTSCEKDPWVYDASRKDNIFFVTVGLGDTIREIFCPEEYDSTYYTAYFPMELVGIPKEYDRVISCAVAEHDTLINTMKAGEDYIIPDDFVLPEYMISCFFPVRVKIPSVEREDSCFFAIKVVSNDYFDPALREVVQVKFKVAHPQYPRWWDDAVFGKFSEKKFRIFVSTYRAINQRDPDLYRLLYVTYNDFASIRPAIKGGFSGGLAYVYLNTLAEEALIPAFERLEALPEYDAALPEWYERYKETGEISIFN